jgi:NAD(P)H-flavin reductase
MYRIIESTDIQPNVKMFKVHAPGVSRKAKPGQFVIIRSHEYGERIPITIAGVDPDNESVTIYFAEVGVSSKELGQLKEGDDILNFSGPLGNAIPLKQYGEVLCVGGGVFQGANYYLAEALHRAGNRVSSIVCARNRSHMFLVDELKSISEEIFFATEDGSDLNQFLEFLESLLEKRSYSHVFTFGPTSMQKAVCEATKKKNIATSVNLFPIMVDGTGMCGACRVTVAGTTRFACIDGPEFDGHLVDFDELISRMRYYTPQEKIAMVLQEEGVL